LLLIVLTLLMVGGVVLFTGLTSSLIARERLNSASSSSSEVLQNARLSLLGFAASVTDGGTGNRLGNFPTPDILNTGGTAISYDGLSDSNCLGNSGGGLPGITGASPNKRCLGRFPVKSLPLAIGVTDAHDPSGEIPWLATSPNLDYWDSCLNFVNSEILNFSTAFSCPTLPTLSTTLPYPWLTVYDKEGNILSNRVAAVLIMPGEPIATETRTQARSTSSPGSPTDYLDPIQIPLGCTTSCIRTFDNAGLTSEFISIPAATLYADDAQDVAKRGQRIKFNDVLIYITIDELMIYLEKRVLKEMANAVDELSDTTKKNIGFPWAAPYTSPTSYSSFASVATNFTGLFPFFANVTTPTPPLGYPTFQTGLDWTVSGLSNPARTCVRVRTGPNRWINTRQFITAATAASGTLALANTTCTWKGLNQLSCTGTATSSQTNTFEHFSNNGRCVAGGPVSGSPPTYTRDSTITFTTDATCSGSLTTPYSAATASQTQRWAWNCTSVQTGTTFSVGVFDVFTNTALPATGSASFSGLGSSVTVTNMRYQPLMPYWFYQNEWYKTAFYAVSPTKLPGAVCGASTTLTVGGSSLDNGLVILAGSRLPNLPGSPTQTRPSAAITDYLEQTASTDFANCIFKKPGTTITSTFNDQLLTVQ